MMITTVMITVVVIVAVMTIVVVAMMMITKIITTMTTTMMMMGMWMNCIEVLHSFSYLKYYFTEKSGGLQMFQFTRINVIKIDHVFI